MKLENFNKKLFFISLIVCVLVAAITSIAMAASEEGTGSGSIANILAGIYFIFRFPVHTYFWKFFSTHSAVIFYSGLFLNCLFYSLLIERISSLLTKKKK